MTRFRFKLWWLLPSLVQLVTSGDEFGVRGGVDPVSDNNTVRFQHCHNSVGEGARIVDRLTSGAIGHKVAINDTNDATTRADEGSNTNRGPPAWQP